jgi:Nif-specific regulatory protein
MLPILTQGHVTMNTAQLCPAGLTGVARVPLFSESGRQPDCRVIDELQLLFDISYTLESSLELREVIRPVLARMSGVLGLRRGAITLLQRGEVTINESVGLPNDLTKEAYLKACREVIKVVTEAGQAVVVPDISKEPMLAERWREEVQRPGATDSALAYICVPIRFGEEVVGCLSVERSVAQFPNLHADRRLLSVIANIIAQVVHFHRLTDERISALRDENERLQKQLEKVLRPSFIVGNSCAMRSVYRHVEEVAGSVTTVLIRGESGVGKELVARALHEQSPRKGKAFVKFNCAALPESIIESELFGHEKGAFTGAIAMRKGRFEIAAGGTIFLDEIGDISPTTQVKLLRVLQEKEFERVGGHTPIRADVRVIAATSRNLEEMIQQEKIRADLYYRLNVFPIYVPPLRDRKSDLLLLADHFVEKYATLNSKTVRRITTAAIDLLTSYHWPGNVRELENCMERAVLLCRDHAIDASHLPPSLQKKDPSEKGPKGSLDAAIGALEFEMIVAELKACDGNMARSARALGLTERQMGLRVKKLRIDYRRFRRGDDAGE